METRGISLKQMTLVTTQSAPLIRSLVRLVTQPMRLVQSVVSQVWIVTPTDTLTGQIIHQARLVITTRSGHNGQVPTLDILLTMNPSLLSLVSTGKTSKMSHQQVTTHTTLTTIGVLTTLLTTQCTTQSSILLKECKEATTFVTTVLTLTT